MAKIDMLRSDLCYSVADIRALENYAMRDLAIPGIQLMARAGRAAFEFIAESVASPVALYVFCGGGNNGGDGFVVAGLAADAGWPVTLIDLSAPSKLSAESRQARDFALQRVERVVGEIPDIDQGLIVDALLGIGFSGSLRGVALDACRAINQSSLPVISLDTPSGVNADTGSCDPDAVQATTTITFIALKRGLLTGPAENHIGRLILDDLGLEGIEIAGLAAHRILGPDSLRPVFPPRFASAHKGAYGHLLVVGGNDGMSGAAILATEAALTLGVGKVSVATRQASLAPLLCRVPEAMARPVDHFNDLKPLLDQCTAIVIGPGLGKDAWAEQMMLAALSEDIPTLVDADALNLIATGRAKPTHDRVCFTPHPGEAAQLLQSTTAQVQQNRFEALQQLENSHRGQWLLKGNGTLLSGSAEQPASLNRNGNPGMASGGMGDVLSGLIGAILAQGYSLRESTAAATYIHGAAADLAATCVGEISLRASDLITSIPEVLMSLGVGDE